MFLDSLRYFTWLNEPENVRFSERGMIVEAPSRTDFWQNNNHNIRKDDGCFFYSEYEGDFTLNIKWKHIEFVPYAQFGLMLRLDEMNWAKISLMMPTLQSPQIGCVITNNGNSDWSITYLHKAPQEIWYRLVRHGDDFLLYFSEDDIKYHQIRLFNLNQLAMSTVKIGAYACSPQNIPASAVLEDVRIK